MRSRPARRAVRPSGDAERATHPHHMTMRDDATKTKHVSKPAVPVPDEAHHGGPLPDQKDSGRGRARLVRAAASGARSRSSGIRKRTARRPCRSSAHGRARPPRRRIAASTCTSARRRDRARVGLRALLDVPLHQRVGAGVGVGFWRADARQRTSCVGLSGTGVFITCGRSGIRWMLRWVRCWA